MTEPPVLVVGAGIGGLVAALELAANGVPVVLLERAAQPGGKMRQVTLGEVAMDAGPTVFTMRWVFEELFDSIGERLADHVSLRPVDVLARHAWKRDEVLDLHADKAQSAEAIGDFAGSAAARGYLDFCDRAARIYRTLDVPFLRGPRPNPISLAGRVGLKRLPDLLSISPFATMWQELGRYFADPRLRQLFGRYATYCGSSPYLAPATLMLVAHVEQEGVWLIDGGMHRLAQCVAALARKKGAVLRFNAPVDEILVRGGRACGVRLAGGEEIAASAVVFNGDSAALSTGLLGEPVRASTPRMQVEHRSLSALTCNLLARTDGFPLSRHTVFFSDDYAREFDDVFVQSILPTSPTVYVCAQDREDDGSMAAGAAHDARPVPERLLLIINAPATGDTRRFTAEELARCESRAFELMASCGLKIQRDPHLTQTTSPRDFERLFPATGGALYGRASHGWAASFSRPGSRSRLPGLYLAGGSVHPGPGVPMAALSGRQAAASVLKDWPATSEPAFDIDVPRGGYAWWYVDALSDDGAHGLTIIGFIGSVFSPYYAWARRRTPGGAADPANHCAINVALYGRGGSRWAMTERGRSQLLRDARTLRIGPSAMRWEGDSLVIDIDEITVPFPTRIRGSVRVLAPRRYDHPVTLAPGHRWCPIAPCARVEVELGRVRWQGPGYLDSNQGDEPLERAFKRWNWSRAELAGKHGAVFYDLERVAAGPLSFGLRFDADGTTTPIDSSLAPQPLPSTLWRVAREARSDAGTHPTLLRTLTDAPFYARSLLDARWFGERVTVMHESLSLERFDTAWAQTLLPFRMPRRPR